MYKKFMRELDKIPHEQFSKIRPYLQYVCYTVEYRCFRFRNLRYFSVIDLTGKNMSLSDPVPEFAPAFEALYLSKPVTCKSSGVVIEGLVPPTIAIVDVRVLFLLYA